MGREQSSLGMATHVGSRDVGRNPREWPLETSGVHVQKWPWMSCRHEPGPEGSEACRGSQLGQMRKWGGGRPAWKWEELGRCSQRGGSDLPGQGKVPVLDCRMHPREGACPTERRPLQGSGWPNSESNVGMDFKRD